MVDSVGEMVAPIAEFPNEPDRTKLRNELSTNGFTVVRNVLTPKQLERLRLVVRKYMKSGGLYQYGGKFQLHAMYVAEEVTKSLTTDKILDKLKEITQPLDVVSTGEGDMIINTTLSWYPDVPNHPVCKNGTIFSDESFRVYKIALYLQDQDEDSRATLGVRQRSHLKGLVHSTPEKGLSVRAGDAIIFHVRMVHGGQMPPFVDRRLRKLFERTGPRLHLDAQKAFTVARSIIRRVSGPPDCVAVFMTLGPSGVSTGAEC